MIDLTGIKGCIEESDLVKKNINEGDFIVLKTNNSFDERFNPTFVYLSRKGALYLKEKGVIGIGIDSLGIERDQPNYDTHRILLESGILILEGLRLIDISEEEYI